MTIAHLKNNYHYYYEPSLFGRYINADHLNSLLKKHSEGFDISVLGKSVMDEEIHFIKIGTGKKRILMWSQMHGNESTTTKSLADLLNVLSDQSNETIKELLDGVTIGVIPMLNPDGARVYTRLNANNVDLNRDAQNLTQPESRVLRACFDDFKPDFCFNLHGQRTIFSAGCANRSAVVSFLSPAQDVACSVTETRQKAMAIIVEMNRVLQQYIPEQVGTYDDAFNINCVGDTFQVLNVPTVLFEAGHFPGDYTREKVRALIFQSLWTAIHLIAFQDLNDAQAAAYFEIPQNAMLFYDIIIRNAKLKIGGNHQILDVAIQYEEKLDDNCIVFIPKIVKISDLSAFYGHKEIDAKEGEVVAGNNGVLEEGFAIDFVLIDSVKYLLNV